MTTDTETPVKKALSGLAMVWPLATLVPLGGALLHLTAKPEKWSKAKKWALAGAGVLAGLNIARWQLERFLQPAPDYEVLASDRSLEVRRYPEQVVAETYVAEADFERALEHGFQRIAKYIFGGNRTGESLQMTSPVTTTTGTSEVTALSHDDGHLVTFLMPPGRTVADLPVPNDARVVVRTQPGKLVAVYRFSGRYTSEAVAKAELLFRAELAQHGLRAHGAPSFSGYDAPSTLPFLRRNEIWVEIAEQVADSVDRGSTRTSRSRARRSGVPST